MTIIPLLLLTLAAVDAIQPSLNIQIVNSNNGYAIVKTNEKPILESYLKILHLFNITKIEESAYNIKQAFDIINTDNKTTMLSLIAEEYNNLIHNIRTIIPNKRPKRGLINFAGKLSKYIYGTMDSDDAAEIYAHLTNLDNNMKNVVDASNEQVAINNNLLKIAEELKNHTNTQTLAVKGYLYDMKTLTNTIERAEEKMRQVFELFLMIQKLNKLVTKLSDIILLSKLNVLAHDIFTREEAEKYNITREILPFLGTNVIFEDKLIIFVLKVPRFTETKFFEALIIPFPNVKKEELDTPVTKVIMNYNDTYEFTDQIIKRKQLKSIRNNCITNILNINNQCNYRINKEESIEQLENYMIITKNLKQEKITHNCTNENLYVEGNNVLNFHYCSLEIRNITFTNENTIYMNTMVIHQINLNTTKIFDNITLETLNFETTKNRENIKYIEFKQNVQNNFMIGIIGLIIIIILIVTIVILAKKRSENITNIELKNYIDPFKEESTKF